MEHLLKLQHSPAQDPRRVWSETIAEHRARIEDGGGVGGGSDLRGKYALKRTRFSCRRFVDNAVQDIQGTVFTALLHCKMTRKRWPEDSSPQLR